jgi:hypothetical protein
VRAIISKGWSARMSKGADEEVAFPEECYSVRLRPLLFVSLSTDVRLQLDKVPHEWVSPALLT